MLKKFTTELSTNILQIIVVALLLPMVFAILSLTNGTQNGLLFILDAIGEIKTFDAIMDFISIFLQSHDPSLTGDPNAYLSHVLVIFNTLDGAMFQLLSVTLCVRACNLFCDIVKWPGMRIIPSVVGVILGYAVAYSFNIPIAANLFLLVLVVVIDMVFLFGRRAYMRDLFLKYLAVTLKVSLEMLQVLLITCFVAILLVIWQGIVANFGIALLLLVICMVLWFALAAVNRYLLSS